MEIFLKDGEISIVDKWAKTEMALKNGADLVIELPTVYSVSSAENFAEGAIKILSSFNMPTTLSFGSECGDVDVLTNIKVTERDLYKITADNKFILSIEKSDEI